MEEKKGPSQCIQTHGPEDLLPKRAFWETPGDEMLAPSVGACPQREAQMLLHPGFHCGWLRVASTSALLLAASLPNQTKLSRTEECLQHQCESPWGRPIRAEQWVGHHQPLHINNSPASGLAHLREMCNAKSCIPHHNTATGSRSHKARTQGSHLSLTCVTQKKMRSFPWAAQLCRTGL